MKLGELLVLMGVTEAILKPGISRDSVVILMPEESDGFDIKDVIYFPQHKETGPQMWFTFNEEEGERWLTQPEEDDSDDIDIGDDGPLYEREGDMCALPEVAGEVTEAIKEEKPKIDPCEFTKHKVRRA